VPGLVPARQGAGGQRSIPDPVQVDLLRFAQEVNSFLDNLQEVPSNMDILMMNAQFNSHVMAGHIPLTFTATEIADHLGNLDTGSLPVKGTDER